MTPQQLGRVGAWGGLGGAINALLCYLKWPVAVGEHFHWHIVPAGAVHGALLAVIAVWCALAWMPRSQAARISGVLAVGWLAGWLSYMSLDLSIMDFRGIETHPLWWSFQSDQLQWLWMPWLRFGLVSAAAYAGWNLFGVWPQTELKPHVIVGVAAGALGSLWWWTTWHLWYFALLHGAIWGALVGYGVWKTRQSA